MSWLKSFKSWSWENRLLFAVTVVALIPVLFSLWPETQRAEQTTSSVDTYIPRGFVLIPIDVLNYEALDSILGRFAYVDLYSSAESGAPARLIGRHIRLLRAPQNPSHFAALVPESDSGRILSAGGAFTVVVRKPGPGGTEFVNEPPKVRRKIIFEGDRR